VVNITIDAAAVSAIFAGFTSVFTAWNTFMLHRVDRSTNGSLHEAIAAREAAERAAAHSAALAQSLLDKAEALKKTSD
jgi:hypothetical protein